MNDMTSLDNEDLIRRISRELADGYDEEFEMEIEDRKRLPGMPASDDEAEKEYRQRYFSDLFRLQGELVKLQDWVVNTREKVVILFEGRDAAGKGGVIKRITQRLNPRTCRVVALPAPNDRERTQWYFQRYVPHLPAGGEIVLFDQQGPLARPGTLPRDPQDDVRISSRDRHANHFEVRARETLTQ